MNYFIFGISSCSLYSALSIWKCEFPTFYPLSPGVALVLSLLGGSASLSLGLGDIFQKVILVDKGPKIVCIVLHVLPDIGFSWRIGSALDFEHCNQKTPK